VPQAFFLRPGSQTAAETLGLHLLSYSSALTSENLRPGNKVGDTTALLIAGSIFPSSLDAQKLIYSMKFQAIPADWEVEAGGLRAQGHLGYTVKSLSQKRKTKTKKKIRPAWSHP
jgi:hypothetical protein